MKNWKLINLLLILLLGGCVQSAGREGQGQLQRARLEYEGKNYTRSVGILSGFLKHESNSREAAYAYYLRGLCYRKMGPEKDNPAKRDFEKAIQKTRDKIILRGAHTALGHTYFESSPPEYESAVKYYQKALPELEDVQPKDAVLYRLGVALQCTGQWSQADLYLSRCFNNFKKSLYAEEARRRFGAQTFRLQTGAFKNLNSAQKSVIQLKQAGRKADWTMQKKNGVLFYIVRTDRYNTMAEARRGLGNLTRTHPKAIVVAVPLPGMLR